MAKALKTVAGVDQRADTLRVPPHSQEAEQAVLGGLMIDNGSWDQIADRVSDVDFYRRDHALIFRAIAALAEDNSPFDIVTVSEWLERNHELEHAGGLPYLGSLAEDTPSAANIRYHADIVRERAVVRQLIRVGTDISNSAYQPEGRGSRELLDQAEQAVFKIAEQGMRAMRNYRPIAGLLTEAVEQIDLLHQQQSTITGVPTGFTAMDNKTSGLQRGDLVIIAGRPSMGKTSFAMNIVEWAALNSKLSCAVFSMEMSGVQLAMRMLSSLARIDHHRIRTGQLEDEDWPRLTSTLTLLEEAPIVIDDSAALSPTEIRARTRRIKREFGLDLVVIDYLQLMSVPGSSENRATEISEISRSLKALAKELDVPVIALSQLNRSVEQRQDKRPLMFDLRESGSIEQDADLIMFIYRDEVYNEDTPQKGLAEVNISKQRNGPTGMVQLTFLGQYTRFENYIPEQDIPSGVFA